MDYVVIVNKIQRDSTIVGLQCKYYTSDLLYDVEKSKFTSLFSNRNIKVLNAKLTSDLKIVCTDSRFPISVVTVKSEKQKANKKGKGSVSRKNKGYFPMYPTIELKDSGTVMLYHGSGEKVGKPVYGKGKMDNDYGRGFYCTQELGLAKEWAAKDRGKDGIVNKYSLKLDGLRILRLRGDKREDILAWFCILVENRNVAGLGSIAGRNLAELKSYFMKDYKSYDIIVGYRADDSFFSIVRQFLLGNVTLEAVDKCFRAGGLGNQVVLKSKKAFDALHYKGYEEVGSDTYRDYFLARDKYARDFFYNRSLLGTITIRTILKNERQKRGDYRDVI